MERSMKWLRVWLFSAAAVLLGVLAFGERAYADYKGEYTGDYRIVLHYMYVGPSENVTVSQKGQFSAPDDVVIQFGGDTISTPLTYMDETVIIDGERVRRQYYQLPGVINIDDGWINGKKIALKHVPVPEGFALAYGDQPEIAFGEGMYKNKEAADKVVDIGIPLRLSGEKTDISKASSFCNVDFTMNTLTYKYTGKEIRPPVKVYINTLPIREGTDYTVSYENNIKMQGVGETYRDSGRVVITGKGNFCGVYTKYFSIMDFGAEVENAPAGTGTSEEAKTENADGGSTAEKDQAGSTENAPAADIEQSGDDEEDVNTVEDVTVDDSADRPLEDGYYQIAAADHSKKFLEVSGCSMEDGANVQIYTGKTTKPHQTFHIEYVKDMNGYAYYKMIAVHSGKAVEITGGGSGSGENIGQWAYWGGDNQLWRFEEGPDGYYIISGVGTAMDNANGSGKNKNNVLAWWYHGESNQEWILQKRETAPKFTVSFKEMVYPADDVRYTRNDEPEIAGVIKSNYPVSYIRFYILNSSGKTVLYHDANFETAEQKRTTEIHGTIPFAKLTAGTYYYRVKVRSEYGGRTAYLKKKKFTIY